MTVLYSPQAEDDLRRAVAYLAERSPRSAGALASRIFAVIGQLAAGEFEGPARLLASGEEVRSFAVPPVRIYYRRQTGALWILRIYDQRQPPIER